MNQYTLTITLEPLSKEEPESISLQFSATDREKATERIRSLLIPEIDESLMEDNQKVTIEFKQN